MSYIPTTGAVVTASGTYTPTLFNTTGIASSTAYLCQYLRVGSVVTVSGKVDVNTNSVSTVLGMSLPIATNFGNDFELGGTMSSIAFTEVAGCLADATNDRASFQWVTVHNGGQTYSFIFTYRII